MQGRVIKEKTVRKLTITKACHFIGITREAFYKRCVAETHRTKKDESVLGFVKEQRMMHPRIEIRKNKHLLAQNDIEIGRDRLFSRLIMNRLLVQNRRAYHRTTNSNHRFYCHPNRIKEDLIPERPEQLWVADITYLATRRGSTYLSLVTDAYSRKSWVIT